MTSTRYPLHSLDETRKLAESVASRLRCGDVVTLAGDLGAGKTTWTQYLVQALSPQPVEVTSPTFTLLQTYPVRLATGENCELYHYDLYRIDSPSALLELGLEEAANQLAIIEWPEKMGDRGLPVTLALSFTLGEDGSRCIAAEGDAARWSDLLP